MRTLFLPVLLAVCMVLPSAAAQGRVWRVAPAGGDFTEIRAAVAVALSGDTILVASFAGSYQGFLVTNKALTIMAEDARKPMVLGEVYIGDVPGGQTFRIVNLMFRGRDYTSSIGGDAYALIVGFGVIPASPPATLVFAGCEFETGRGYWPFPYNLRPRTPSAALSLRGGYPPSTDTLVILDRVRAVGHDEAMGFGCSNLTLCATHCEFRGGEAMNLPPATSIPSSGGHAAAVGSGTMYFAECQMNGGDVLQVPYGIAGQNGGSGLLVADNANVFVFSGNTQVVGGAGGHNAGSRGGHGLWHQGTGSQVSVDGSPFVAGSAGIGAGQPGQVVSGPAPIPRLLSLLSFDRVLVDRGAPTTLAMLSRPAEVHVLFLTRSVMAMPLPIVPEPVVVLRTLQWLVVGAFVMDQHGSAALPFTMPSDPALQGAAFFAQSVAPTLQQLVVSAGTGVSVR